MKKFLIVVAVILSFAANAQVGKTFWFAAPEVTDGHDGGRLAQEIRISTFDSIATVRIYQPANLATGLDTTIIVPASSSSSVLTTAYQELIETKPFDQVVSTGILVESDVDVTVYYEVATPNNTDIFALKSSNALGTEFYVPFQTLGNNGNYTPTPYSQFNIVATENNTTVWIFPKIDIFNHAGNAPYKITLNRGESYSGRAIDRTAANHPVGVVISSDKPIAVTYADDSVEANGCRDLLGDQLVPTSVIGKEYIVNSNSANLAGGVSEQVIIIATQNFTTIEKDGAPDTVLFAGQSYTDVITASSYYKADKPIYLIQITGFGCELGSAILPPLNCAGSDQVSFSRNVNGGLSFFLSVLVRSGSEDFFTLDGDASLIQATDFAAVPGTGGEWLTMFKQFNTTEVSPGNAHRVVNSQDVFSLGIVNGNTNGGTRYGYFSLFQSEIIVSGGTDQFVCSGNDVNLTGSVRGGAVTGKWSVTNGTGSFDNDTDLITVYEPSASDYATGNLTFVLESTGLCTVEYDTMVVNFTAGPTIDAGANQTVCYNNADINLNAVYNGIVSSVLWSTSPANVGGFSPGNTSNPTTYTPTTSQKDAGSFKMYVTSVGVGSCQPVTDSLEVTVVASPIVEAGPPLTSCANNPDVTLGGSVTTYLGIGQGVWSGGGNSALPSNNALTGTYSPTPTEITNGSVVLTLTSTNDVLCNSESDNVTITYTTAPTVNAGNDQILCSNNAAITLNGSFTAPATQAVWVGGTTSGFSTNRNDMNAVYTPTPGEIAFGSLTLTLQSSAGNGTCIAATDDVTFTFTSSPTMDAGTAQTICANNDIATFTSVFTTAAGVQWSGGTGTYVNGSTANPLSYQPNNIEKSAGSVMLYATTTGMGNCTAVVDSVLLTIQSAPIVEAGVGLTTCKNNPDVTLGGSVTTFSGAGQGSWAGGTNVVSPSNNALTGVYTPTPTEITNGTVVLTLTSTNNGLCNAVNDNVTITYTTAPTVNAGNDQILCANNAAITLNGSFTAPATQAVWVGGTTSGFSTNRNDMNAVYTPTPGEIALGSLTLTLQSSAGNGTCIPVSDDVTFTFTPSPTIDAGAAQTVCANNDIASFTSVFTTAAGVQWSGGTGTYVNGSTANPLSYQPNNIEKSAGSVMLYATTTGIGNCSEVVDSVLLTIQAAPIVEAGVGLSVCKNNPDASLTGSVATFSGAGQGSWTGGTNLVSPSANALTGTYTPTPTELTNGSVVLTLTSTNNGLCNAVNDNVTITYTTAPTISAGADQTLCANNAEATLAGVFTAPATQGSWIGGAGTFTPNRNTSNAVYTPTLGEIALGSLTLTFETSAGLGNCSSVSDQMTITFTPTPSIDAGNAVTVCENNSVSTLTSVFTTAAGVQWSGGLGTYVSGSTSNPLTYDPSTSEKTAGSVMMYATTTGVGNCVAVTDSVLITVRASPIVDAGGALSTCANNPNATLSGSITTFSGFGQGIWSGGSGSVLPANDALAGSYGPTNAEITNGTVVLTLTSTNNGICNAESDNVTLTIDPSPIVNAGLDQTVCFNNSNVSLSGSATNGNAQWIGGNGTFNPNRTALNAVYTPTNAELSFGSVTLTLETTNNGLCNAVTDDMIITFSPSPTVEVGSNQIVCSNNSNVSLAALRTIASGVQWSGGNGSYLPNAFSDNITYQPTAPEIASGEVTLYSTTTGIGNCIAVTDSIVISIAPAPIVAAGSAIESCENNPGAQLVGVVTPYTGLGQGNWSGGLGFVTPTNDALTGVYTPTAPEIANGAVSLRLTSTNNGICNAEFDDVLLTIVDAPIVEAGSSVFVCGNNATVNLNGSVSNAGGARWLGGLGTFSPNRTALNAVYTPTQDEINLGSINLTLESTSNGSCTPVQDQMTITFTTSPTVDAGLNQTVCANNVDVQLAGNFSIATGAQWNGFGGTIVTGTNSDMNAIYRPSASEISAGSAIVYLTSTGNGLCASVSDSIIITITTAPTVDAGTDLTVCANNSITQLNGSFTVSGGVEWSGGNGSFTPSSQVRDAKYFPTTAEIASGFVNLTLQTSANGTCNAVSDNVLINITPSPTISAGANQSICENNPQANLSASVTLATGVVWSGGNGGYLPDQNQLSLIYNATPTEVNNGSVDLIVTSTGNGICNAVSDTMSLVFTTSPVVDAGNSVTICANNANSFLSGQVFGASGGRWKNFGGSFNPDNTTLNASYLPSSAEILAGKAVLYLESTGNGNCLAVEDSVVIAITPAPSVNAGTSQTSCANNSTVQLGGSFTNAGGITWSGGTGSFNPAITDLNAQYNPSPAEIAAGGLTLTLSTTNNGNCFAVNDDVIITISGSPTVQAGVDQTKCANNSLVQLSGDYSLATGGVWSGGVGTFTPNATSKTATYKPTQTEINSGSLTLTYATTGNGSCNSVADDVLLTFTPSPTVEAGLTKVTCANNPSVVLDGSFSVATGVQWYGYSGTFSTSETDPVATYTPSSTEILNGLVKLKIRTTGNGTCFEATDSVVINVSPSPFVDAGNDVFNCIDDLDVSITGLVTGGASSGQWSTSGTGFFTPNANSLNAVYKMSSQDSLAGTITLTLTSTNNGDCLPVNDDLDVFLTTPGISNAGSDRIVCANNSALALNGQVTGGALGGVWTTSGSGQFLPNENTLNAVYVPSNADTTSGTVTLSLIANSCDQNTDDLLVTITDAPVVNAGIDQAVCSNEDILLNGIVTGASTTGIWSSLGTGTFDPDQTTLNSTYKSSADDRSNGEVSLILISSNIGSCVPVIDTVHIIISPAGIVSAGNDVTICANNSDLQLNGSVSGGATAGRWTSTGTGKFMPNDTTLAAVYEPSSADKTNGFVELILTGNSCDGASDTIDVTITDAPTVSAGADETVCENNSDVNLNGQITIAGGGIWSSTGAGTFVPNVFDLNAIYKPGLSDQNVVVYLKSFGNGSCLEVTDSLKVTVTPKPLVNAGLDQTICDGVSKIDIKGTITGGASTGLWSTLGTGGFDPGAVLLETDYLMSSSDSANRGATLILTSTSNGNCNAESDTMFVAITDVGVSNAGDDVSICANDLEVQLNGNIQGGATQGYWITSGSGTFAPDSTTMNAIYTPSSQDSLNGLVTVSLVSNSCDGAKDDKVITITPAPFVDAGPDQVTCVDDLNIALDGIVAGASTSGRWTSSGTGSFIPNNQTLNATYRASANDSISGNVSLTLTPTNIGNCTALVDNIVLRITTGGTVNAGPNVIVCSNSNDVQLSGNFGGGASQATWSSTGTGVFKPNASTIDAVYSPSNQDKQDGLLTLTLTANSCDQVEDEMTISITQAPTVDAGNNLILCENKTDASLSGSVSGAAGAIWTTTGFGSFTPSNSSLTATYKPSSADIKSGRVLLYLTTIGNGNCTFERDSITITFTPGPKPNAGLDLTVCKTSSSVKINGAVTGPTTTGTWSTIQGGGFFLTDPNDLQTEYLFGPVDTTRGFVRLLLTSTNNDNCNAAMDTVTVTLGGSTFASAGSDVYVCNENLIAQLNGFVGGGASTGTWSTNGDGIFSPATDILNATYRFGASDSVNRSVQLVLTANSGGGCTAGTDTVRVRVSEVPSVDAGSDIVICQGKDTVIYAGTGVNTVAHKWVTTGSGLFAQANDTSLTGSYLFGLGDKFAGVVKLILTGESIAGCQAEPDTTTITIGDPLDMDFVLRNLCVGDETDFADSTKIEYGTITSWNWRFGDGDVSDVQHPKHVYDVANIYEITLQVTTNQGCVDSLKRTATVRSSPKADFELDVPNEEEMKIGDEITFVDQSVGALAWTWVFGTNLDTAYTQFPVYVYNDEGNYDVTLSVLSQFGCSDTIVKEITILTNVVLPPNVPNAFTPNGDDNNDVYFVRGGPFETLEFKIYNEWGNLVFETSDPLIGWDGKKDGDYQAEGVYSYTLKATLLDGRIYKKSGDVTLIR